MVLNGKCPNMISFAKKCTLSRLQFFLAGEGNQGDYSPPKVYHTKKNLLSKDGLLNTDSSRGK